MGPRGGDELNLLLPGKNYGWPLYSKGLNYNGTPVEYGKQLGIEFDLADIVQPLVDWTPSPAISSFVIYEGSSFPEWRGNLIVGSLKARELYRLELSGTQVVHIETLLADIHYSGWQYDTASKPQVAEARMENVGELINWICKLYDEI